MILFLVDAEDDFGTLSLKGIYLVDQLLLPLKSEMHCVIFQGELPMDTSEPSDDQRSSQTENSSAEESTAALSRYRC